LVGKVRVAVAGVGNACSALVQGIQYYKNNGGSDGLLHAEVGGYGVSEIEIVSAFDIAETKVGKDLSEAIFAPPNNAPKFVDVPELGVRVQMSHPLDEAEGGARSFDVASLHPVDVVGRLREEGGDVLVNLISGGSENSSRFYAEACLEAGCAFLNATPTGIASEGPWAERFREAGLALAGDDLLDQVGATVVHMGLLEFLHGRGVVVDESYQLDVGGGTESVDTLERTRERKRSIKTAAVTKSVPYKFPLVSGSTDFVDFLGNQRDSFFWVKGTYFGGAPFTMDVKLSTVDAPNSGAILIDAIRGLKTASDRGMGGAIIPVSSYAFKKPPESHTLAESYGLFREFAGS